MNDPAELAAAAHEVSRLILRDPEASTQARIAACKLLTHTPQELTEILKSHG